MATWVLNGTTVRLADLSNSVAIGTAAATRKLDVTGIGLLQLQDKGGEVFNVKAYGAVGDGVADDTHAIVAAINATPATGGVIYFPPGLYKIISVITVDKPVTILGAGMNASVIRATDATQTTFNITVTPSGPPDRVVAVVFRDLGFDKVPSGTQGVTIDENNPSGLQHGIRIENCRFKGHFQGVHLRRTADAVIENCIFWSGVASESDIWIDDKVGDVAAPYIVGCVFADFTDQPPPNDHVATFAVKVTAKSGVVRVQNNAFGYYNTQFHYDNTGAGGGGTANILSGNIMEGARFALIRLTGTSDGTIDSHIHDNSFAVSADVTCLLVDPSFLGSYSSWIVSGNKFRGASGSRGIYLNPNNDGTAKDWIICNNIFTGFVTTNKAIELSSGVAGVTLYGNTYIGGGLPGLLDASMSPRGLTVTGDLLPAKDNAYNLGATGTLRWKDIFAVAKSSVLDVDWGSGKVLVPVLEGPEYLLYDSGTVVIGSNGRSAVDLDARLVATCNTGLPYRVLTSGASVAEKSAKGFVLGGTPGQSVDWMLLAVRAGFENVRWRDVKDPEPVGLQDPARAIARKSVRNNLDRVPTRHRRRSKKGSHRAVRANSHSIRGNGKRPRSK